MLTTIQQFKQKLIESGTLIPGLVGKHLDSLSEALKCEKIDNQVVLATFFDKHGNQHAHQVILIDNKIVDVYRDLFDVVDYDPVISLPTTEYIIHA